MTPEDKAHLTPVLSSRSLLCHLKLKHCRATFAHGFLFSRTVPSVHLRQRRTHKQTERREAISSLHGSSWLLGRLGFKVL